LIWWHIQSLAFQYILWCSNYWHKKYNYFFEIRQRPATLNFFLKCLQCISDKLKCLPNRLGSVEWLLNRLVRRHFLPFLKFICSSSIAGSLVHACFLHATDFLFACCCCCCCCLPVCVVAVFTFGFLQSRLEQHCSWGSGCCLLFSSLYVVYCCLIQLCRVLVLRLYLGLWFFLVGFLFGACYCLPRVFNVGMMHLRLELWLHFFALQFA
jgi:hypothetical protein